MNKTTKKRHKPIDIDAHFKYRCPNCNIDHWISLNQAKTKNYKIVCDCGKVFSPKRIKKISVIYVDEVVSNKLQVKEENIQPILDNEIISKCVSVLVTYGFTSNEAETLVKQSYIQNPSNNCTDIIKNILSSIGVNNE